MNPTLGEKILDYFNLRGRCHLQDVVQHFGAEGPAAGRIELVVLDLLHRGCLEEPGQFNRFLIGETGRCELRKLKAERARLKQALLFT
jgi:hypothetical protein